MIIKNKNCKGVVHFMKTEDNLTKKKQNKLSKQCL